METTQEISLQIGNPRLLQITFHTFRHWKATVEYHKTKDILHVKNVLGHKSIRNTFIYIQLEAERDIIGKHVNIRNHKSCTSIVTGPTLL